MKLAPTESTVNTNYKLKTQLLHPSHKSPAQGWLILYALLQVPLSTVYMDPILSSPPSTHTLPTPAQLAKRVVVQDEWLVSTNAESSEIGPTILMIPVESLYTQNKNRVSKSPEPDRLQPTSHSLVTLYFQTITSCETGAPSYELIAASAHRTTELQYPRSQSHLRWRP